jgi:hypothetical protein
MEEKMNKSIIDINAKEFEELLNIKFNPDKTQKLLETWYESIRNNKPDFSIYNSIDYLIKLFVLWDILKCKLIYEIIDHVYELKMKCYLKV